MTVNEFMERVNSSEPNLIIAYIRDAFNDMASRGYTTSSVQKQDIAANRIRYNLPSNIEDLVRVSVMYKSNKTELLDTNDQTFVGTPVLWTNVDFATFNTTTDLSLISDATDQYCYLDEDDILTENKRYRFTYDATIDSGTFELQEGTNSTKLGDLVAGVSNMIEFTASNTDQIKIVSTASTGSASFDNLSLVEMSLDEYKPASRIVGRMVSDFYDEETE